MNELYLIEDEIRKYPLEYAKEFADTFPCENPTLCFRYYYISGNFYVIKSAYVKNINSNYFQSALCSSTEDFWNKWNRFKKLKVFI